jgi:hypothetical protein
MHIWDIVNDDDKGLYSSGVPGVAITISADDIRAMEVAPLVGDR